KSQHIDGLQRQNIKVNISDDWTFEYCLAKHGLFDKCCDAIRITNPQFTNPTGDDDTKATAILAKVGKTDFAYNLAELLQNQLDARISDSIAALGGEHQNDKNMRIAAIASATK